MDQDTVDIEGWPTGFMLIQGNRLEVLSGLLGTWLQRYPLRPLESEVVLVQSNGIGQWLKLGLAAPPGEAGSDLAPGGGCGIAAAIDLMLPGRFLWRAYRGLLSDLPETSAYDKVPLGWRLYRLLGDLDALAATPAEAGWLVPLRDFLASDGDPRRRYQLATRVADLYDQYQVYRADWLIAWQQGEDRLIRPNGRREPLPDGQGWQPLLWRRLVQDLANEPGGEVNRAEIHRRFLAQAVGLAGRPRPAGVPRRVIVFGLSSLPRQAIEVLEAIAPVAQVMLFVHNPSRHYWGDLIEGRELFRGPYRRTAARKVPEPLDDDALHLHGHPLLAAWGKQGRDYLRLLDERDDRAQYEAHFAAHDLAIDLFESPGGDTLLQQLQDDILELRPLAERRALAAAIDPRRDRSLEFLVAHSPQREVEILHDQLLDAFAEADRVGRPLAPRDLLVMVPDIAAYAPHIEAVFDRLPPGDGRRIPFHIADQSPRQRLPLLIGLERLLDLPQARFSVSEVLDLLDIPALRRRFGLDAADLAPLRAWIEGANVRWGLDAEQRQGLGLPPGLEQNTWRFGLERMLLGFAVGRGAPWRDVEPFDEVGGLEAALVGPLTQLLEALARHARRLRDPGTPGNWATRLGGLLDDLFEPASEADERILYRVREALEQWLQDGEQGGVAHEALPLDVVREALLARIDEPTLSQRFLAGAVNFATLMPMRAIPFRQIWLLGMNDGDYPRRHRPADFDLMADDERPGDRSRREDDRYLFLEALLSAREKLVISWVGRSVRDNAERPPSVLVGQLRDHLAAGWRLAAADSDAPPEVAPDAGAALVVALTTVHPLQPFSRRYFQADRAARLFTYASEWRDLHRDAAPPVEGPLRLAAPLPEGPIGLAVLGRFLRHPVRTFYTERLALPAERDAEPSPDAEPFEVGGLAGWALREAVIGRVAPRLSSHPDDRPEDALDEAIGQLARAGHLPLRPFDAAYRDALREALLEPLTRYRALLAEYAQPLGALTVRVAAAGLVLEDSLTGRRADAAGRRLLLRLQPSALVKAGVGPWHHVIRDWPAHLAAQLDGATTTCVLGPGGELCWPPLGREAAEALLGELIEGLAQGLAELLPLACQTGFAVLRAAAGEAKVQPAEVYEGRRSAQGYPGERDAHAGYRRFWPDYAALSADPRFRPLIERLYRPPFELGRDGEGT